MRLAGVELPPGPSSRETTNWLPEDEAAQGRFDFESEMARLNAVIAIQPYRCVANRRKLFRKTMAVAGFAGNRASSHHGREKTLSATRKNVPRFCPRFASRPSHAVYVAAGLVRAKELKRLARFRISRRTGR